MPFRRNLCVELPVFGDWDSSLVQEGADGASAEAGTVQAGAGTVQAGAPAPCCSRLQPDARNDPWEQVGVSAAEGSSLFWELLCMPGCMKASNKP